MPIVRPVYPNELYHYGVKGMHWGIRRYQPYPKGYSGSGKYLGKRRSIMGINQTDILRSRDGKTVMVPRKQGALARFLGKVSPKIAKRQKNYMSYDIRDDANNNVGYAELERQKNGKVLYGNWISVNPKHRGKGHAQRAMDTLIREGKKDKYERFNIEVPGDSKDARHIYEKYGFKAGKRISDEDDIWGGLTTMSRHLAKRKTEKRRVRR